MTTKIDPAIVRAYDGRISSIPADLKIEPARVEEDRPVTWKPELIDAELATFSDWKLQRLAEDYLDAVDARRNDRLGRYREPFLPATADEARGMRASNLLAQRERLAQIEQRKAAEASAKHDAREQAAIEARATYKQQIAHVWQGTAAELDAAFGQLWNDELLRRLGANTDGIPAANRADLLKRASF